MPIPPLVTRCFLELPLARTWEKTKGGGSRKKSGKSGESGFPGLLTACFGGRQILFRQDRWVPVEFLGSLPIWGTPLTAKQMFRFLFPGKAYAMKRPTTNAAAPSLYAAPIGDLEDGLKLLADQLALTAWEGEPIGSRQTGSVLIFPDSGVWKGMLKDKNTARCLWVASESLLDIFAVLESSLGDPMAVWRDDRHAGHEQAKRNKPNKAT